MTRREETQSFGQRVRALREGKGIGLRRFAAAVGMSPTYLSKIERGDFKPPAEAKVLRIAEELGVNPDDLLALAGRVQSDLPDIIKEHPRAMADFLRTIRGFSSEQIEDLRKHAASKQKPQRTSKKRQADK